MENTPNPELKQDNLNTKSLLESLLFVSSKPMKPKELMKFAGVSEEQTIQALEELKNERTNAGVVLLQSPEGFQFATNSANSTIVKNYLNAELREKLTDATVEVLAIIAYRQPISKAEIEAIRGVNSQYSVRHLLMRGLIEKIPNPGDARSYLYQTTSELLQHLGVQSVADLPDFSELTSQIKLPDAPIFENPEAPTEAPTQDQEIAQVVQTVEKLDPELPGEITETKIVEVDLTKPQEIDEKDNDDSTEDDSDDEDEEDDDEDDKTE